MTTRNPSTAMADALVDELVRNGLRHVVVAPGSRSTALAIAVARHGEPTVHVRHDERSAGFLALGLARASGTPVAVVTTSGTAVANLAPAVVEADAGDVPLLLLTADRPAELHHVGANQTIEQSDLFGSRTRWHVHLPAAAGLAHEPAAWRSTACLAMAAARGTTAPGGAMAAPGPVHCNLAFREPTIPGLDDGRRQVAAHPHTVAGRPDGAPWTRIDRAAVELDPAVVDTLAERLAGRRLLVVAGDGPAPTPALAELVARGWPVVAEPTAGAPGLAHGSLLLAADDPAASRRPEVVLRLGRPTLSRPALAGLADVDTIQVTGRGVVDPARQLGHALVADPARLVADLAARIGPAPADWADAWQRAEAVAVTVVADHLDVEDAPEPAVARRVAAVAAGRPLVVASSLPVRDIADYAAAPAGGGRVHANRGVAGIDGFVSTAVGVALAAGPTVALAGDLSFLHDHNGLLVEDPAAVPLTLVVVDNDGGGLFHHVPAVQVPEFERLFATPHGRDLVAVSRAAGVPAQAVSIDDVAAAAADTDGLRVLVVRTDRHAGAAARQAMGRDLATRLAG